MMIMYNDINYYMSWHSKKVLFQAGIVELEISTLWCVWWCGSSFAPPLMGFNFSSCAAVQVCEILRWPLMGFKFKVLIVCRYMRYCHTEIVRWLCGCSANIYNNRFLLSYPPNCHLYIKISPPKLFYLVYIPPHCIGPPLTVQWVWIYRGPMAHRA